jgi:hypothetical protein
MKKSLKKWRSINITSEKSAPHKKINGSRSKVLKTSLTPTSHPLNKEDIMIEWHSRQKNIIPFSHGLSWINYVTGPSF